jgi:hypothetical protein
VYIPEVVGSFHCAVNTPEDVGSSLCAVYTPEDVREPAGSVIPISRGRMSYMSKLQRFELKISKRSNERNEPA